MARGKPLVAAACMLLGAMASGVWAHGANGRFDICLVPVSTPRPRAAARVHKFWPDGSTLKILFLDGDPKTRRRVAEIAREWTRYANLNFAFYSGSQIPLRDADIRVSFEGRGFWSAVGTGSKNLRLAPRESMSLYHIWNDEPAEFRKHVLHEFGHALGLVHEHQNPAVRIRWNKSYIYQYLARPPNRLTRAEVDRNLFQPYDRGSTNYSTFDPNSIMLYYFPPQFTLDGRGTRNNTDLSKTDKVWIARIYPGRTERRQ